MRDIFTFFYAVIHSVSRFFQIRLCRISAATQCKNTQDCKKCRLIHTLQKQNRITNSQKFEVFHINVVFINIIINAVDIIYNCCCKWYYVGINRSHRTTGTIINSQRITTQAINTSASSRLTNVEFFSYSISPNPSSV